jgi:hypothetical protein
VQLNYITPTDLRTIRPSLHQAYKMEAIKL